MCHSSLQITLETPEKGLKHRCIKMLSVVLTSIMLMLFVEVAAAVEFISVKCVSYVVSLGAGSMPQ